MDPAIDAQAVNVSGEPPSRVFEVVLRGYDRHQVDEHIEQLALNRTRITDKSMPIVGRLAKLVDLNLDYTDVGDKGLEALGGLARLQRLSLDSTNVSDTSIRWLKQFPQLRTLNLYHTFITEKGHRQISDAVPRCEIIFDPKSSDPKRRRS